MSYKKRNHEGEIVIRGDSNLSSFVRVFARSTSLRFTTVRTSSRSACPCSSSPAASLLWRYSPPLVQIEQRASCFNLRGKFADSCRRSFTICSCTDRANFPSEKASKPRILTVLGRTFVVIVFPQDMAWSTGCDSRPFGLVFLSQVICRPAY